MKHICNYIGKYAENMDIVNDLDSIDFDIGAGSADKIRDILQILKRNPASVAHAKALLKVAEAIVEISSETLSGPTDQ